MIDSESEDLLRVPSEAAKHIPGRPNASTIWRWHRRGVRGVRLETIVVGGRRYTSRAALQRFFERSTEADAGRPISTPKVRARSIAQAERDLDAAGI